MLSKTIRSDVKSSSFKSVLDVIRKNYPLARNEIADLTGLSIPSISRILPRLFEDGYLEELEQESAGVGRKTKLITLKEQSLLTAGAEYTGEKLKIAILDEKSNILSFHCLAAEQLEPVELCHLVNREVDDVFIRQKLDKNRLVGIGIAMPGIIDYQNGVVRFAAQTGWQNAAIKQMMEEISGINCVLDNDIKAAAYAEYIKGNAMDSEIAVSLYFGNGLGSALIVNGQIYRGVSNSAGELGHITQDVNGTLCSCGKIGCLQTNIAKGFLLQEARKVSAVKTIEELLSPDTRKEKWAERIVNRFVTYAAMAIDTVVCSYNPDTVILSGDMINDMNNNLYKEICDTYYHNFLFEYLRNTFSIKLSAFNGRGSAAGAGMLAAEDFFSNLQI